jgi:hypothetical protein
VAAKTGSIETGDRGANVLAGVDRPPAGERQLKPLLISVAEFQRMLGIKKTLAFAYLRERRVRSVLAGKKRLVLLEDVERLVNDALESGSL